MLDYGTFGGIAAFATGINNSDKIVGYSLYGANQIPLAFLLDNGNLTSMSFSYYSKALDISDAGHVVVRHTQSFDASSMWQAGNTTPILNTIGGSIVRAESINNSGQVVGTATNATSQQTAFLWQNGSMINLGSLGGAYSGATDINDAGQVVGYFAGVPGQTAFLWENSQMKNLNNLIPPSAGWVLTVATAINNKGDIVGIGKLNNVDRAYMLISEKVFDLSAIPGAAKDAATLRWTAPDIGGNPALAYDLRYSDLPIDDTTWVTAAQVSGEPFPASPGTIQSLIVPSLTNGTRWYFAIKYQFPDASWSVLSNIPSLLDIGFRPPTNGYSFPNYTYILDTDFTFQDMIALFNSQLTICYNPVGTCIPLPGSEQWRQSALDFSRAGHCEGMAITSLRFFTGLDSPASFQNGAVSAHDLSKANIRRNIMYYHTPQMSNPVRAYKKQQLAKTPSQNLTELMVAFSGSSPTPMQLQVFQAGGHAITPFAVEQRPNDWRVWVYDNNTPEISRTVYITPTIQSWSYAIGGNFGTWSGNPGNKSPTRSLAVLPISQSALPLECPWCLFSSSNRAQSSAAADGELWLTGAGHLLVSDGLGQRLGYDGAQFVNEIPGASANPIAGGLGELEPNYSVPLTDTYTIQLDGQTLAQPGTANLVQIGPGYASGAKNIGVITNTLDQLVIAADGSQVEYQPSHDKAVDLLLAVEENTTQGYTFHIRGLDLTTGQPVTGKVDLASGQLVLDNLAGVDGAYDLEVLRSNANRQWSFFHPGITLLATDKHYLDFAGWDGAGAMTLLIDHGGDGSIDETLPQANTPYRGYLPLTIKN